MRAVHLLRISCLSVDEGVNAHLLLLLLGPVDEVVSLDGRLVIESGGRLGLRATSWLRVGVFLLALHGC